MSRDETFLDAVFGSLCEKLFFVQLIFLISVTFLLLSFVSYTVVEPGTGNYVLTVINIATLSVLVLVFGSITYLCNNRRDFQR